MRQIRCARLPCGETIEAAQCRDLEHGLALLWVLERRRHLQRAVVLGFHLVRRLEVAKVPAVARLAIFGCFRRAAQGRHSERPQGTRRVVHLNGTREVSTDVPGEIGVGDSFQQRGRFRGHHLRVRLQVDRGDFDQVHTGQHQHLARLDVSQLCERGLEPIDAIGGGWIGEARRNARGVDQHRVRLPGDLECGFIRR